jgi:hypothetical protein
MENQAENTYLPLLQKSMCLAVLGFAFAQKTGLLHLFININGFSPTFSEDKKIISLPNCLRRSFKSFYCDLAI